MHAELAEHANAAKHTDDADAFDTALVDSDPMAIESSAAWLDISLSIDARVDRALYPMLSSLK